MQNGANDRSMLDEATRDALFALGYDADETPVLMLETPPTSTVSNSPRVTHIVAAPAHHDSLQLLDARASLGALFCRTSVFDRTARDMSSVAFLAAECALLSLAAAFGVARLVFNYTHADVFVWIVALVSIAHAFHAFGRLHAPTVWQLCGALWWQCCSLESTLAFVTLLLGCIDALDAVLATVWYAQLVIFSLLDADLAVVSVHGHWMCTYSRASGVLVVSCVCIAALASLADSRRSAAVTALAIDAHVVLLACSMHSMWQRWRNGVHTAWLLSRAAVCVRTDDGTATSRSAWSAPGEIDGRNSTDAALNGDRDLVTVRVHAAPADSAEVARTRALLYAAYAATGLVANGPPSPSASAYSDSAASSSASWSVGSSAASSARSETVQHDFGSFAMHSHAIASATSSWSSAASATSISTSSAVAAALLASGSSATRMNPALASRLLRAPARFAFRRTMSPPRSADSSAANSATTSLRLVADSSSAAENEYMQSIALAAAHAAAHATQYSSMEAAVTGMHDEPAPPPALDASLDPAFGGDHGGHHDNGGALSNAARAPAPTGDPTTGLGAAAQRRFAKRLSRRRAALFSSLCVAKVASRDIPALSSETRVQQASRASTDAPLQGSAALAALGLPVPHSAAAYAVAAIDVGNESSALSLAAAVFGVHRLSVDDVAPLAESTAPTTTPAPAAPSMRLPFFLSSRQVSAAQARSVAAAATSAAASSANAPSGSAKPTSSTATVVESRGAAAARVLPAPSAVAAAASALHGVQAVLARHPMLPVLEARALVEFVHSQSRAPADTAPHAASVDVGVAASSPPASRPSFALALPPPAHDVHRALLPTAVRVPRFTHAQLVPSALGGGDCSTNHATDGAHVVDSGVRRPARPTCAVLRASPPSAHHPAWSALVCVSECAAIAWRRWCARDSARVHAYETTVDVSSVAPVHATSNLLVATHWPLIAYKSAAVLACALVWSDALAAPLAVAIGALLVLHAIGDVWQRSSAPLWTLHALNGCVLAPVAAFVATLASAISNASPASCLLLVALAHALLWHTPLHADKAVTSVAVDTCVLAFAALVCILIAATPSALPGVCTPAATAVSRALLVHRLGVFIAMSAYSFASAHLTRAQLAWLRVPLVRVDARALGVDDGIDDIEHV